MTFQPAVGQLKTTAPASHIRSVKEGGGWKGMLRRFSRMYVLGLREKEKWDGERRFSWNVYCIGLEECGAGTQGGLVR